MLEQKTESNNAVNFIRATSAYLGDRKILFSKSVTLKYRQARYDNRNPTFPKKSGF